MRQSLLSRFQGTLLAAALGETLGAYGWQQQGLPRQETHEAAEQKASPPETALAGWHPRLTVANAKNTTPSPWGKAAVKCTRALAHTGRWNELEMAAIGVRLAADSLASAPMTQPRLRQALITAEYALATLPIALFFYENETKQQQMLRQTAQLWHVIPEAEAGLLAVGYAIAQSLNERVQRLTLLPRTIDYLQQNTAKPADTWLNLIGALEQTQALIQQTAGLHDAIDQLRAKAAYQQHETVALAFYCFLSTFDNLHLSLLRAAHCGEAASVVCALTGALSGSHHGLSGLPLVWRMDCPLPLRWELSNVELSQLATHLFTIWSGVYYRDGSRSSLAIAAPGFLRPR